jgi:hypothetical protein
VEEQKKKRVAVEDVEMAKRNMDSFMERYLSERGWKNDCESPDGRWRWKKEVRQGITYYMNLADAVELQAFIDEMERDAELAAQGIE